MNVIDLFAGAGGLSEGFRQKGFNILAHVEMDKHASLTLKTREVYYYLKEHQKLDVYENYLLKKINREELYSQIPPNVLDKVINQEITDDSIEGIFDEIDSQIKGKQIDLVIGGPPCQAYSLAGRSRDPLRMEGDPRNYLFRQYIRFLTKYNPNYFVFENVVGMLSAKKGAIFVEIKQEMNKAGYEIDYRVLNSKDFGVLQSRKRVIIIGWKSNVSFKYPNFLIESQSNTIRDLFEDLPTLKAGESVEPGNYYRLKPSCYTKESAIRTPDWHLLTQHEARPNRDSDLAIYHYYVDIWNKEKRKVKYNELPKNLITHKNTRTFLDRFNVIPYESISHTIVAHISKDGHYYIHPDINQNRSISVREAARIQSFPDDYYFESNRTAAFKQIGNSVPPLMARKIAQKLADEIILID